MYPRLQYVLIPLLLVFVAPALYAQVPQVISFQGILSDGDGAPLSDGSHQVVFKLYEAETEGDAIWTETQQVAVISGVFGVLLGSETALDLGFDRPYWLGVTIGNDPELAPRAPLAAAPYSLGGRATVAEWKDGESLIVRDDGGKMVHFLGSDGRFEHAGGGEIFGRLDIRVNESEQTALRARVGEPRGFSDLGSGVFGEGPTGVLGVGETGVAGRGMGDESVGVAGHGDMTGVQGSSPMTAGAAAIRSLGHLHVAKDGHVVLDEVDHDPTAFRFLVWSNDDTVRWRPLPEELLRLSDGIVVSQNTIQIQTPEGDVVFSANTDGSTTQTGSATVGDVFLSPDGKARLSEILFPDGTKQNTAPPPPFDGEMRGQSIIVYDDNGNEVVRLGPSGESFFNNGISMPSGAGTLSLTPQEGLAVKSEDGEFFTHMNTMGDAFFPGSVFVGNLSKQSGSFKIDHPLDPENRYLYHSFVESPDMMNVYNGNAALDAQGEVWVEMPEWFEALNRDYRYQLTAIGAPGPNLFVAEEMDGGRFKIGGGAAGMMVSWQVTGVRRDRYAEENRIQVEVEKPAHERGTLLYKTDGGAR